MYETQFWSGFSYEGFLSLDVFEDETRPVELQLESRSLGARDAPSVGMKTILFHVWQSLVKPKI